MLLITHTENFENYLHYMVGQAQAEACISDKAMQQYFKVMDLTTFIWYDYDERYICVSPQTPGVSRIFRGSCYGCSYLHTATGGEDTDLPSLIEGQLHMYFKIMHKVIQYILSNNVFYIFWSLLCHF